MSFASSPSRDITELFSRRRVTNIPPDQKNLLEQPDSWAVNLKNQPHGLAHIPGHVLETVKAAYVSRQTNQQEFTPQLKKRSASSIASPSSKRMQNGITSTPKPDFEQPPGSSPGKALSWSPSPNRGQPEQSATIEVAAESTTQSSIIHETPKMGSAGPPPRRHYIPPPERSSSPDEAEDDLETRIPDAQPQSESVNRPAMRLNPTVPSPFSTNRTMATPPCAQPSHPTQTVVPNTVVANKETFTEGKSPGEGQFKPAHTYKLIDVDAVGRKRKKSYNERERLPPTITLPPPPIESSMPTSSDSIIPNTYKVPTTQESIRESIEENETTDHAEEVVPSTNEQKSSMNRSSKRRAESVAHLKPSGTATDTTDTTKQSQQRPVTPLQMDPSKITLSSNPRKQLGSKRAARKSIPPPPLRIEPGARLDPYEIFVDHYPAYAGDDCGRKLPGTKENFVVACVYLNYLRKRHALRDCLYDDFIRAFPCHYREYVDRIGKSAMVAIDWFNKLKDAPAYDKYVVHRGNLSHILKSYPEEFAVATASIDANSGSKKDSDAISIYTSSEEEEEEYGPSSTPARRSVENLILTAIEYQETEVIDAPRAAESQIETHATTSAGTTPTIILFFQVSKDPDPGAITLVFSGSRDFDSGSSGALAQDPTNLDVSALYFRNISYKATSPSTVAVF
ncbi:hypothetical protein NW762_006435 [Fusarium torreyae]|uniref:Uncharacterized protein n=1 Tax=Fusarium torreyae TaxID=1237075 RepID=A0A9W8S3X5_9HYPO|nr:hypothetical protein NW762_006435 [Fusarium torreyae]